MLVHGGGFRVAGLATHYDRMLAREWQNCPLGDIFGVGQSGEDVGFPLLLEHP